MTTIAFVGAGSVVFTRELMFGILGFAELSDASLRLHDIDRDRLETATAITHRVAEVLGARPTVSSHDDLASAVRGADFVINTVNVGGHPATVTDFEVPAQFGLRQTIGDTLGVGGVFRALRTFPVLDTIAGVIRRECPDAWLLNYTNPMSMNVSYLAARHPDLKVLGLCHSVHWSVVNLNTLLGLALDGTRFEAAGVNHQSWLLTWERDGHDLYPLLDRVVAADEDLRRRVRVDLYLRVGRYPTETSEHSSEYVPWYLRHDDEVARLRIPVAEYLSISARNLEEYHRERDGGAAGVEVPRPETTEYAPQVIHSVVTDTTRWIHATTTNSGLLPQLQPGLAVEVPTIVDGSGPRPKHMGEVLPRIGAALNRSFLDVVDLVTHAALAEDRQLVRQALMVDPNTAATLTLPQIDELVPAMVRAHGDLLPAWLDG